MNWFDELADKLADHTKQAWCSHNWRFDGVSKVALGQTMSVQEQYVCTICDKTMHKTVELADK